MKESTIENNINKSINALKINELGYAKEYVNRILVEVPDHALAMQIRKYIELLKSKDKWKSKEEDFFFSTINDPMAKEMMPLIEFFCTKFKINRLGSYFIEKFIEEIEKCNLNNEVLNNFYQELKTALPIEQAREKAEHEKWEKEREESIENAERKEKEKIKKIRNVVIIIAIVVIAIIIYQTIIG